MKLKTQKRNYIALLMTLLLCTTATVWAAAITDTRVKNYRGEQVTIFYKMPGAQWVSLGTVSKKSARVFRNITIGAILKAEGDNFSKEFRVESANNTAGEFVYNLR